MKVCKYCGKEYPSGVGYRNNECGACHDKSALRPRFAKARDDLREKLGLKRLGEE